MMMKLFADRGFVELDGMADPKASEAVAHMLVEDARGNAVGVKLTRSEVETMIFALAKEAGLEVTVKDEC
jgi:hypothetical protein